MNAMLLAGGPRADGAALARATVVAQDSTTVWIRPEGLDVDAVVVACDVLWAGASPEPLAPGDVVLAWAPADRAGRGVILGRVAPPAPTPPAPAADAVANVPGPDLPDELLLEARHSLTLRVGDGSITIRADGRILIKGKDLVSHAERTNRIKGGSVAIN